MMKKLMATLLAAALAFTTLAFVGCGGGMDDGFGKLLLRTVRERERGDFCGEDIERKRRVGGLCSVCGRGQRFYVVFCARFLRLRV